MKLIRFEKNGTGIWRSGNGDENELWAMRYSLNDAEDDIFYELSSGIHSPSISEFLNLNRPPSEALFYFTETGYNKFDEHIDMVMRAYAKLGYEITKVEIDLKDHKKYEIYYQDEDQVCVELKDGTDLESIRKLYENLE